MFIFLKKMLAPPVFNDDEKTHHAYLLHTILWGLIFVPVPYVSYTLLKTPEFTARALTQGIIGEAINFFLLFLLHRGYVYAASMIQISSFWFFFTISAVTGGGVHGEAYLLGYPLVIVIAGILTSGRVTFAITALSLIAGGAMVYAEAQEKLVFAAPGSSMSIWVISLAIFPMGMILQYLSRNTVEKILRRAHASEEKYRLISQVSSDYTFTTEVQKNGEAGLSWVAGAFEKMTGYTYEEYLASGSWLAHVHPDDREKDTQDMESLHKNQDIKSEIRTFTKNGEIRWEQIFAHPIWDEKENRLIGIYGAVRDITEQKKMEATLAHERDLLQIFLDNIPDTVYFKDVESRFVRINQAQARFLKVDNPRDVIGKTDLDFQNSKLAQEFMAEEKQIIETGQAILNRIEFNPTDDGKPRWLSATKVPVKDSSGLVIGTIGISRDVTEQKESQEKLQKIFLQQAAILNNIPDMAWLKDKDSRYIAVNEQFVKTVGMQMDEIPGKTDFDIWQESFAKKYRGDDLLVMQTRQRKTDEEFQVDSNGRTYWVETTKTPILNENGEVIGTTGIAREITERKNAQEIEQRRRIMLEKVVQLGKRVTESNDLRSTIKKIWHGVHDDLEFDRLAIFLYNAERNTMDDTIGTNNEGQIVEHWDISFPIGATFATLLQNPDGVYFTNNYDVENNVATGDEMYGVKDFVAVAAWAGDKPVAVICADNNITKRLITADQLEALRLFGGYAGLAIENARLNSALQGELSQRKNFIVELEAKNAELERFTYTVSHDLKSPLVTIRGFLGYLERDAQEGDFQKFRRDVSRIETAVEKMQNLLQDLLDLSRIGRLINPPVEVSFNEIVKDALEAVHGQIQAKNVQIEYESNTLTLKCDRVRMVEVFQNLIDNAIKFMGDQPRPRIEIGTSKNEQNQTIFYVKDNGIGVAPQFHENIFGLFNKLDTNSSGTGIGLALVKRIIEIHGGRIWIESQINKGTIFYFILQ